MGLIASPLGPASGELLSVGSFNLTRGPWRVGESPSPGITNRSQNLRWIQRTVGGYVTTTDLQCNAFLAKQNSMERLAPMTISTSRWHITAAQSKVFENSPCWTKQKIG